MHGSLIAPAGDLVALIQLDTATDTVVRAFGLSLVSVTTPGTTYVVRLSSEAPGAPDAGSAFADCHMYSAPGAAYRQARATVAGPGVRDFTINVMDAAGALAASPSGPLTVTIQRTAIPGME